MQEHEWYNLYGASAAARRTAENVAELVEELIKRIEKLEAEVVALKSKK